MSARTKFVPPPLPAGYIRREDLVARICDGILPPERAQAIRRDRVFRLLQLFSDTGLAVEWTITSSPSDGDSFSCRGIRAQSKIGRIHSAMPESSARIAPHRVDEIEIPHDVVRKAALELRSMSLPLEPGLSQAAPYFFPHCVFHIGNIGTALMGEARLDWQNPRKGPWEPAITCFHELWFQLECVLDNRTLPRTLPVPPRGGMDQMLKYADFLKKHPIERDATPGHSQREGDNP